MRHDSCRSGIYKKANELATLCGAQIGIVVFSPTGKPFSFGQPSIEAVVKRYLNENTPYDGIQPIVEAHRRKMVEELNECLDQTLSQLEAEKKRGKSLRQSIKMARAANATRGDVGWWEAKIEELSRPQLEAVSASMEQFYGDLMDHVNRIKNSSNTNKNVVGSSPDRVKFGFDGGKFEKASPDEWLF